MDKRLYKRAQQSTLAELRNQNRLAQMTHTQGYGQTFNPNDAFSNTAEAFAHGIYNAPGNLVRLVEMMPDYMREPGYYSDPVDEFTGANLLNEEFTPQTPWEHSMSFTGEMVADPSLLASPLVYGKAVMTGLRGNQMADNALNRLFPLKKEIIAGKNARNADLDALARAERMKADGVDTDTIYADTRWYLDHPDGQPRFEIDDSGSSMGPILGHRFARADMVVDHPELYSAYPDIRTMKFTTGKSPRGGGVYRSDNDSIDIGIGSDKGVALHELQHAIQSREGMARGGSPEGVGADPFQAYKSLAGEAEARLVQNRMNMSMDERLANPFYQGYDVPLEDQIVRLGDGESLSLPMEEASSGDIIDAIVRTADDPDLPDTGYRGGHTAPVDPEYHAPLHEMNLTYPDDIYSPQAARYYGHGDTYLDAPSFNVINRVRGKPDADVTMYRAVPLDATNEILPGDWVTTNQRYAKEHGEGLEKYKILKGKTKAKKLRTDGNSPHEYGYTGARLLPIPAGLLGLSIMEDNESY